MLSRSAGVMTCGPSVCSARYSLRLMAFRAASESRVRTASGTGHANLVGPLRVEALRSRVPVYSNKIRLRSPSYAQARSSFSTNTNQPGCALHPDGLEVTLDDPPSNRRVLVTSMVPSSPDTRTVQVPPTVCGPNVVMSVLLTAAVTTEVGAGLSVPAAVPAGAKAGRS